MLNAFFFPHKSVSFFVIYQPLMPCLSGTDPSGPELLERVITAFPVPAQKPRGFHTEQMPRALPLSDISVGFIQAPSSTARIPWDGLIHTKFHLSFEECLWVRCNANRMGAGVGFSAGAEISTLL